jgi:hypothetical protein
MYIEILAIIIHDTIIMKAKFPIFTQPISDYLVLSLSLFNLIIRVPYDFILMLILF